MSHEQKTRRKITQLTTITIAYNHGFTSSFNAASAIFSTSPGAINFSHRPSLPLDDITTSR